MNMINIIWFFGGVLATRILAYILKPSDKKVYMRRGLIKREYKTSEGVEFSVEVEVHEIESSATKSKIKPIKVYYDSTSKTSYDSKVKELLDELWIPTTDIEWINDKSHDREEKINEILK